MKDLITKILKEETQETGQRTKLEKTMMRLIIGMTQSEDLPENFNSIVVDNYYTDYGQESKITVLLNKPFNEKDSNKLLKLIKNIKDIIKSFFKDKFVLVSVSTSTIEHYNKIRSYYDERKLRRKS